LISQIELSTEFNKVYIITKIFTYAQVLTPCVGGDPKNGS